MRKRRSVGRGQQGACLRASSLLVCNVAQGVPGFGGSRGVVLMVLCGAIAMGQGLPDAEFRSNWDGDSGAAGFSANTAISRCV